MNNNNIFLEDFVFDTNQTGMAKFSNNSFGAFYIVNGGTFNNDFKYPNLIRNIPNYRAY